MSFGALLFLFIGCSALAALTVRKKWALEKQHATKSIFYLFLENSLEFLVPLSLVLLFFLAVWSYFAPSENTDFQSLILLEKRLTWIASFLSHFKLGAGGVLIGLIAIYVLGLLRIPGTVTKNLCSTFSKYRLYIKRIYIVAVLLTSFTLLGAHLPG